MGFAHIAVGNPNLQSITDRVCRAFCGSDRHNKASLSTGIDPEEILLEIIGFQGESED